MSRVLFWKIRVFLLAAGAFTIGGLPSFGCVAGRMGEATGFRPTAIDLGRQPWHTSVPFSAEFVNGTREPVIIAAVKSACACTGIEPKRYVGKTIEPGRSLEIGGELSIARRLGQRSSEIELMLASGAIHVLTLEYDGYATYSYQPTSLQFEAVDLDNDDEVVQSVVFSSKTAQIASDIVVDSPWLQVGRHERGTGETEIAVCVVKRNLPHGKNYATVSVKTTDPFKPEFSFRVMAEGVSRVRAIPGHLFLKPGREGVVRFVDSEGQRVTINSVETQSADFRVFKRLGGCSLSVTFVGEKARADGAAVIWVTSASGVRCRFLVTVVD